MHYSQVPNTAATGGKAQIVAQQKSVRFTRAEQQKVHKVLARFLATAVARRHVAASWPIVGPGIREGMTKRQWETGSIPVQPYPVSKHGLGQWDQVQYSYAHDVGLEVMLFPERGSGQAPASAQVDVIKTRRGRWLVNYFMPDKYHGNPVPVKKAHKVVHHQKRLTLKQRRKRAAAHKKPPNVGPPPPAGNRPGRIWWALPLSILGLIILVPLTLWIYTWIRNRRAYDSYMRSRKA